MQYAWLCFTTPFCKYWCILEQYLNLMLKSYSKYNIAEFFRQQWKLFYLPVYCYKRHISISKECSFVYFISKQSSLQALTAYLRLFRNLLF